MYQIRWMIVVCVLSASVAAGFENIEELISGSEVFSQFQKRLADLEERDLVQQHLILKLTDELAEQKQENIVLREKVAEIMSQFGYKNTAKENYNQTLTPRRVVTAPTKKQQRQSARPNVVKRRLSRGGSIRRQANQANVAFSAGLTHSFLHAGKDQNIVFDNVQTNIASGYNAHHGVFIAPVAGTYVFHSSILAYNNREVWCRFVVNGVHGAAIYARGTDTRHDQGANMIIVQLNQGDDVSVQNMVSDDAVYGDPNMYTTFSGFLLQGDGEFIVG